MPHLSSRCRESINHAAQRSGCLGISQRSANNDQFCFHQASRKSSTEVYDDVEICLSFEVDLEKTQSCRSLVGIRNTGQPLGNPRCREY
uniref:Uncharacterized protein n=1 Tax=Hyaloperonospora arabidopsidis (strain Emoy2) TaxID=559515 RepID=M4BLL1_HYAAE